MKASLILNQNDEIALIYGEKFDFIPEWASIDVEQQELYIGAGDDYQDYGKLVKLDEIKQEIYKRILPDTRILLVLVKHNNITKPVDARWVPLMIAQQLL